MCRLLGLAIGGLDSIDSRLLETTVEALRGLFLFFGSRHNSFSIARTFLFDACSNTLHKGSLLLDYALSNAITKTGHFLAWITLRLIKLVRVWQAELGFSLQLLLWSNTFFSLLQFDEAQPAHFAACSSKATFDWMVSSCHSARLIRLSFKSVQCRLETI